MRDVYYNGEFDFSTDLLTVGEVFDYYVERLADEGRDLSGDTAVLHVEDVDGTFDVWYE